MSKKIQVVDLFCGIGGLSYGFKREGFQINAGIDNDGSCAFAFEHNNNAKFIEKDIKDVSAEEINSLYSSDCDLKILVGCAPCQPFSLMNTYKGTYTQEDIRRKSPIHVFADLVEKVQPDIVSMENVPGVAKKGKDESLRYFIKVLERNGYNVETKIVECIKYGIPQTRKRFVLLASKNEGLKLIDYTHETPVSLKDTIGSLEAIKAGEQSKKDRYHVARKLDATNLKRITMIPKNGGTLMDVDQSMRPECYRKKSGKSYINNVYGRMRRDEPAPTMTTFCTGLGNGRFGHPEQNRAISVREAARIQTFPDTYEFTPKGQHVSTGRVSKQIGNAVPVRLGEVIARSIKSFLFSHGIK